jgi:hypothetical protein
MNFEGWDNEIDCKFWVVLAFSLKPAICVEGSPLKPLISGNIFEKEKEKQKLLTSV